MKTSSAFTLVVGALIILAVALAGVLVTVQAQPEEPAQIVDPAAAAAGDSLFSYQGDLRNAGGNPITNSSLPMSFRLFSSPTGGNACWTETLSIDVQNGQFSVVLGQVTAIPSSCVTGDAYLELTVNGETMAPRERLTSVASAVRAATADSAAIASTTSNLTDGATAQGDVQMKGNILAAPGNSNMYIRQPGGNSTLRLASGGNIHLFFDSDNNSTSNFFTLSADNDHLEPPLRHLLIVEDSGNTTIRGDLKLQGSCTRTALGADDQVASGDCSGGNLTTAAVIEANLQTPEELDSDRIERFSEGELLCWAGEQLEICNKENDRLVQAVASHNGKPIVLGAEKIRVLGSVTMGDILVSSSTPGYAMVNNDPLPGTVIGQALEDFEGGRGLIKAMIRKW